MHLPHLHRVGGDGFFGGGDFVDSWGFVMSEKQFNHGGVAGTERDGADVARAGPGPGRMDREWRDEWIRALRSGEFKQIPNRLRNISNGRCCLGVLCDIRPDVKWRKNGEASVEGNANRTMLPFALACDLGIGCTVENWLTAMNDGGRSFYEIADWIEANL